jgi:hypothetical protein
MRVELELELILSRELWERGGKGGASLQKQARACAVWLLSETLAFIALHHTEHARALVLASGSNRLHS